MHLSNVFKRENKNTVKDRISVGTTLWPLPIIVPGDLWILFVLHLLTIMQSAIDPSFSRHSLIFGAISLCAVQSGHLLSRDLVLARGLMWDYIMGQETFKEWLIRLVGLFVGLAIGSFILSFRICSNINNLLYYRIDLKTGNLPVWRLCLYCLNQMIVGVEKVAMYR